MVVGAAASLFLSAPNTNPGVPSPLALGVAAVAGVAAAPNEKLGVLKSAAGVGAPVAFVGAGVAGAPLPKANAAGADVALPAAFVVELGVAAAGAGFSGSFSILRLNAFNIASSLARLLVKFLVGGK